MRKIITGKDLRMMREHAGFSQEALSEEIHIARSSISKLETGKAELNISNLTNWMNATQSQEFVAAAALGIDVGLLQQALEMITSTTTVVGMILGGIF